MKALLINEIIIADVSDKKAICQTFNRGLNVVTSHDNGVGKSCLVKSLYHSLGADVKFDKSWRTGSKLYVTNFSIGERKYTVARRGNSFLFYKGDESPIYFKRQIDGLPKLYAEIFGFSIYLQDITKKYDYAYPICYFLPYYIDQDAGWGRELYKSFARNSQYNKKHKSEVIDFHLALLTKEGVQARERKAELDELIKELKAKAADLLRRYEDMCNEMAKLPSGFNEEEMGAQIESERLLIETKIGEMVKSREQLKALQEDYYHCEKYRDIILETRVSGSECREDKQPSYFCPSCGVLLQDVLTHRLRGICFDENKKIILVQIESYLADVAEKIEEVKKQYTQLGVELHAEQQKLSCVDYFKANALKGILVELQEKIAENERQLLACEKEVKELKVTDEKAAAEIKKNVYDEYYHRFQELTRRLNVVNEGNEQRKIGEDIGGQGSEISQGVLCHHLALLHTICEQNNAKIAFPFVLDSPRGNEVSDKASADIMSLLASFSTLEQIILATLDFSKFVSPDVASRVNLIELKNEKSLLDAKSYELCTQRIAKFDETFNTFELVASMQQA